MERLKILGVGDGQFVTLERVALEREMYHFASAVERSNVAVIAGATQHYFLIKSVAT